MTEFETSYGDTLYKLRKESAELRIGIGRILDHFNLPRVTEEEIDHALDQE